MSPLKNKHPLRRMVLAGAATVSGIVLLLALKPHTDPSLPQAAGATADASTPLPPSASAGTSTTRTVTGAAAQTTYGPVQVRITVTGSRITGATAVQSPSSAPKSKDISSRAIPKLNQEAMAAQSANIDSVSGATYTSAGYQRSLQSALDRAGV